MRTTVTLDPDVDAAIRRLMHERRIGFKEAVNEAIRAGLATEPTAAPDQRGVTATFKMGFTPEANLDKALALAGRLEDEAIARRLALQK